MLTIKEQVGKINATISSLFTELRIIQKDCPHNDLEGEYKADTGNWCPDDDSYWIDAHCCDCNKRWMIESNEDDYRGFEGRIIRD